MRDQMTLSDRVGRIEDILVYTGIAGDRNEEKLEAIRQRDMNEGNLGATGQQPPSPTSFEEIINRIQTGTDRICMIASKLEEIGNRVYGTVPEEAAGLGGAERKPDGMLDHTFIALNWLDIALCRLHSAAVRLERV